MAVRGVMLMHGATGICFGIIVLVVTIITVYINNVSNDSEILTIKCNQSLSGNIKGGETIHLNYTNMLKQNVTFTNCRSGYFEINMYFKDSEGNYIQSQSTNECDGIDCYDPNYCTEYGRETFTMVALFPGNYIIELHATGLLYTDTYVVDVMCNTSAHFPTTHLYDIQCGQRITGNISYPDTATVNFTNPREQDVVLTSCGSTYSDIQTNLYMKDENGIYVHNKSKSECDTNDCNNTWCDYPENTQTFLVEALSPGQYTIDLVPVYDAEYGGNATFVLTVICINYNTYDIECGERITGNISSSEATYFIFQNDELVDVSFTACTSNFECELKLRNSIGDYIHDQTVNNNATLCNNATLGMERLIRGLYTLELTPVGDDGTFTVDAMCNTSMRVNTSIQCGGEFSGQIPRGGTVLFEFDNTKTQNVLFSNCHSQTDTLHYSLFLRNSSGISVQSQSTNGCDGTNCFFATAYCSEANAETFVMPNLPGEVYTIEMSNQWYSDSAEADVAVLPATS